MAPPNFADPAWNQWNGPAPQAGQPASPFAGPGYPAYQPTTPPPAIPSPPYDVPAQPSTFGRPSGPTPTAYPPAAPQQPSAAPAAGPRAVAGFPPGGPAAAPDFSARAWTPADEPWRVTSRPRRRVKPVIIGVAVVAALLAGAGGYGLFFAGKEPQAPDLPAAVKADQIFSLDPQGRPDGRIHELTGAAASGSTIVVTGSELGGGHDRGQFLRSTDGGRTWELSRVRAADGDEPPSGEVPRQVTGGEGAWVAIGGTKTTAALWTSGDAQTWIRQSDAAASAFGPKDRVAAMTRTESGFIAVGQSSPSGGSRDWQGVLWSSQDGKSWQRFTPDQLGMAGAIKLDQVAAANGVVLARGATRTDSGFWRSTDAGRSWAAVKVPQAQGSYGSAASLAAGRGGFFIAREAKRKAGKKTIGYAVILGSKDGMSWRAIGQARPADYKRLDRMTGSADGLAVLTVTQKGDTAVLRSPDGRTWQRASTIRGGTGKILAQAAIFPTGVVIAGKNGPSGYLTTIGVPHGVVDLTKIADAVHPGRTLAALAQRGGQTVAVGSTNGDAAVWNSRDGRSWTRAQPAGGAFKGAGTQELTDVTAGEQGWVAVGRSGDGADGALVLTSSDGVTWRKAHDRFRGVSLGVAYGPAGYVTVGLHQPSGGDSTAVAWHSSDLKGWNRGSGAGANDFGAGRWMRDVAATSTGYVAVGGQSKDNVSQPVVWTSIDGKKWAALPANPPLPSGATSGYFRHVVSHGPVLVALGTATTASKTADFAAVSSDDGKTWRPQTLGGTTLTSVTATPKGFTLTGITGPSGRSDVVVWTSRDGRSWRQIRPRGLGLDGRGAQQLTAAIAVGDELLAVGLSGDSRADYPTLWRTPLP